MKVDCLLSKFLSLSIACGIIILSGCNTDTDPRAFHVAGTVSVDGVPIPNGKISFYPDNAAGNCGPMGTASIINGKYDTQGVGCRGTIGGPHLVEIDYHVKAIGDTMDVTLIQTRQYNPLPDGYTEKFDIPQDAATLKDFVLSSKKR